MTLEGVERGRKALLGRRLGARLVGGLLGAIGYVLSPLSWWNDPVVNIPMALLFAALLHRYAGVRPDIGFAVGYWATNTAGIILLFLGGNLSLRGRLGRRGLAVSLAASTAYTIAAVLVYRLLG